jgi:hypothetical protein
LLNESVKFLTGNGVLIQDGLSVTGKAFFSEDGAVFFEMKGHCRFVKVGVKGVVLGWLWG